LEINMFGRKTEEPVDALEAATATALNALSLFTQARSGLQVANDTLAGVIDEATNEIQAQRERVSAAQTAQAKNAQVIGALDNLVGA
jgi:hypothetical protein